MKRLRCFVAMAFDHEDTDTLYKLVIKEVLQKEGIHSIRVDRVEHQERIDQFIIDNIGEADFAIADLTYARPSVYYEAGFAERQIPVIYTCRRDHFGGGTKAPDGYPLKIHFDLMTKNIITWSDPRNAAYPQKLRNRVRFVTEPLRRDRQLVEERRKQVEDFRAKPLSVRLKEIAGVMKQTIRSQGFNSVNRSSLGKLTPEDKDADHRYHWVAQELTHPIFPFENYREETGQQIRNNKLTMVFATVVANLKPTELREFRKYINEPPSYNLSPIGRRVEHLIERYIICSTSKLDVNSAQNQLHQFSLRNGLLSCTIAGEVPLQRPTGFQESYKWRQHNEYVFVRRQKHADPVFRVAAPVGSGERDTRKPLQMRDVPRTLVLSLIGQISRIEEVGERVSSAITTAIEPSDGMAGLDRTWLRLQRFSSSR